LSSSIELKVKVVEKIDGKVDFFNYTLSKNILKVFLNFYNIGSVGYKTRIRIDVFNETNLILSGWSEEKPLQPGQWENFEVYLFINQTGNFSFRTRIYYGNEILDYKNFSLEIENLSYPRDIFGIEDLRVYDNYIKFAIKANKTLKNVIVVPSNYPITWVFEQRKIKELEANKRFNVILPFDGIFSPVKIKITILTEDGLYATTKRFLLQKESGFTKYLHILIDLLKNLLNI
jgi:hypothetical protein